MPGLFTQDMTPQQVQALLASGAPTEGLETLPHATLYQARENAPTGLQSLLAPYEHQAFAREYTYEHPERFLGTAGAVLAYQPYKALMGESRSAPSLDQVTRGLTGVAQGLHKRLAEVTQNIHFRDPFGDSTR